MLDLDELPDGRVKTVTIVAEMLCLTHHDGQYGALDNLCPHQGGPLGEGSIEIGLLRRSLARLGLLPAPGKTPGGCDDGVATHPVDVRDDGVFVGLAGEPEYVRTVSDVIIETMVNWGVRWCFGMVGQAQDQRPEIAERWRI